MATLTSLPPGTYALTATVDNPDGDRRTKNDWRQFRSWETHSIFYVTEAGIRSGRFTVEWSHPVARRLVPYLAALREEAADVLVRVFPAPGEAALAILNALERRGALPPTLLTELIAAYQDDRID
jgi:hypothetical protein